MARALQRTFLGLLVLLIALLVLVHLLYWRGARGIAPGFRATSATYPEAARLALWRSLGGKGEPTAGRMTPTGVAFDFARTMATDDSRFVQTPSLRLAGRVARLAEQVPPRSQGG